MEENAQSSQKSLSPLRKINLIFRFSYTIPFFVASLCGIVYALPMNVPLYISILIPTVVLVLAILVNFSNDYFDHMSGVDKMVSEQRFDKTKRELRNSEMLEKIYWDGNQFDTGLVSEKQGRVIMAILFVISAILSVPIIIYGGWPVVVFGLLGLIFTYFYTAPPINFGARGLGEITVAISFFMMCACSYYVATGTIDIPIIIFSAMLGLVVGLMRLVDTLSAYDAHKAYGEKCISVRLGIEGTVPLVKAIVIIAYALAACLVYFNLLYALLFLTIPIVAKAWKMMNTKENGWELLIAPNFFGFSLFTEILFIVAVLITSSTGIIVFW